jgi:phage terminase large subunit
MALSEAQRNICDSDARFRVSVTGRRFGKTFCAMRELARHATKTNQEVLYIAPSYRMAKSIAWETLKDKLKKLRWVEQTNEAELTIRLKSGSKIYLKGAENRNALRGLGVDFLVLDEFQDLDPELWTAVLRPTLSDRKGKALFIGTPRGIGSWSHEMYVMAQNTDDWAAFTYRTIDGGIVDEDEINQAKRDLDTKTFEQEYLATFNTFSGMVYYNFERDNHVAPLNNINTADIHCGMDFGFTPMSVAISVIQNNAIYFVDEISINKTNTEEICDELKRRYPTSRITIYPDAAGRQRKSSAGGKTDISILQNAGFRVCAKMANPPIRDRVNAVNSKLKNAQGLRTIFIDPKCKQIIKSLESMQYKPNSSIIDNNENTHMADAVGYLVDYLYPIKREIESKKNQRWVFGKGIN